MGPCGSPQRHSTHPPTPPTRACARAELSDPASEFYKDPARYALFKFAYYMCSKCKSPYYGGMAACGAAGEVRFNPDDLVCPSCMPHSADADCPKHGREFITYKCQFCCNEALFFCFGEAGGGRDRGLRRSLHTAHCPPSTPLPVRMPGGGGLRRPFDTPRRPHPPLPGRAQAQRTSATRATAIRA
jgi:hypothetical protein